jgi:hypothetical protein
LELQLGAGLPDFSWCDIPKTGKLYQNDHKMYQIVSKHTKWQQNRPNGYKIYQHLSLQDTPKFTQIGFFV